MGYDIVRVDFDGNDAQESDGKGPDYFRRNIWGMGPLREDLERLGMGYWSAVPNFPDAQDQIDAHLRATYSETPGIALHKFCSNDGWWIQQYEAESALKIWEKLEAGGTEKPESFGDDFVPFLTACARSGGMRVY